MFKFKPGDRVTTIGITENHGTVIRPLIRIDQHGNIIDMAEVQWDNVSISTDHPTDELVLDITLEFIEPQCECGGLKANTGHADWCDLSECKVI